MIIFMKWNLTHYMHESVLNKIKYLVDFYWRQLNHLNENLISMMMTLLAFYGFRVLYGQ